MNPASARRKNVSAAGYQFCLLILVLTVCGAGFSLARAAEPERLRVWPVDPLVKVFRDAVPQASAPAEAEVARGDVATFQVVLQSDSPITGLRARTTPFEAAAERLHARVPRFVGYVPVDRPTQKPSKDQLRPPPAEYPDPLLEVETIDVGAGQAQPVWVTVPVPTNAVPGRYHAVLTVECTLEGEPVRRSQDLHLLVHPAVAGPAQLWVTQWYGLQWRHMQIAPERESEEYYQLLRRYARNMAEHRHNVALISPLALAEFKPGADGTLQIHFDRFDRWVKIFIEEGVIGRIEGGHIGGRKAGWDSEFAVTVHSIKDGRVVSGRADPDSAEADAFYGQFFPALVAHLKAKGWLSMYMQHLADEPIASNIRSYRAMASLARKYAPELRIIEACHTKDLVGSIDVWVPQLNYWHQDFAHYQARQKAGDEVWFYTCVFPQGEYANRFLEQPLIKTRLLHWINFRYGATGYLHWGYNQWTADSPFTHTTRPHGGPPYLPAGDPWIVYPGKDGPLDSIRFEAMRDGIADCALLQALAERDAPAAEALAKKIVFDFDRYETDVPAFRAARHTLLSRLNAFAAAASPPPHGRMEEMSPDELEEVLEKAPVAFVPVGTFEHHGWHLPVCFDAIKAHALCQRVAERTGGTILPAFFYGTGGGHIGYKWTLMLPEAQITPVLAATLDHLASQGFRVVVLLTGHYPQEQVDMVHRLAREAQSRHPSVRFIGLTEPEVTTPQPGDSYGGDHAAKYETSIALSLNPRWVRLDRLTGGRDPERVTTSDTPRKQASTHDPTHPLYAIHGNDPRTKASKELGDILVNEIVSRLTEKVAAALQVRSP
jgi:creatinine amidohydrolase/Fe(II)-dependent formamide hydrolase-like protein